MNKRICLENDQLRVQVSNVGAELQSIFDKRTEQELLWQGDPAVWQDRAPWLFPLIGQLKEGRYRWQGRSYALPMHGFASHAQFAGEAISACEARFVLRDTPQTLVMYPWRFTLEIGYRLTGAALDVRCRVVNEGAETMLFSFGAHPGFQCAPGDKLIFEGGVETYRRLEEDTHLLASLQYRLAEGGSQLTLEEKLFDEDALIFETPRAQSVVLERARGKLRFTFGQVPFLGVWSRKRAGLPYVCVEPWFGVDDAADADGELEHKLEICRLSPGECFEMPLRIEPLQEA